MTQIITLIKNLPQIDFLEFYLVISNNASEKPRRANKRHRRITMEVRLCQAAEIVIIYLRFVRA
jgi:hypothetical protein